MMKRFDIITEAVVDRFDHKHLNRDVPYFKEKIPKLV